MLLRKKKDIKDVSCRRKFESLLPGFEEHLNFVKIGYFVGCSRISIYAWNHIKDNKIVKINNQLTYAFTYLCC